MNGTKVNIFYVSNNVNCCYTIYGNYNQELKQIISDKNDLIPLDQVRFIVEYENFNIVNMWNPNDI